MTTKTGPLAFLEGLAEAFLQSFIRSNLDLPRRVVIIRDPDRERDSATGEVVTATGVEFADSGNIVIEWRREAFEEDERSNGHVESRYDNVHDAEQATGGTLLYVDDMGLE